MAAALGLWVNHRPPLLMVSPDSVNYIEQAEHLLAGQGFLAHPYSVAETADGAQPDRLFPPGLAMAVAALSWLLGSAPYPTQVGLGMAMAVAIPLLAYTLFRQQFGRVAALVLAVLVAWSPGQLRFAPMALSDGLALALVLLSALASLRAWQRGETRRSAWAWFLLAGALGGAGTLVRNANLAWLAAGGVACGAVALWPALQQRQWRAAWADGHRWAWWGTLAWAAGAAAVLVPWWWRNWHLFGRIQPYSMPPSTVGFEANARRFIAEQAGDVLAVREWGSWVGWSVPGLLLTAALLAWVAYALWRRTPRWTASQWGLHLLAAGYACAGAAVVVVARSTYEWGEVIGTRHTLAYTPFWLLLGAGAVWGCTQAARHRVAHALSLALAVVLLLSHASELPDWRRRSQDQWRTAPDAAHFRAALDHVEPSTLPYPIVSNWAYALRLFHHSRAVHPGIGGMGGLSLPQFLERLPSLHLPSGTQILLMPGRGIGAAELPLADAAVATLQAQGFEARVNQSQWVVLQAP